eukprot:2372954-Prymnesium_polylepis.1
MERVGMRGHHGRGDAQPAHADRVEHAAGRGVGQRGARFGESREDLAHRRLQRRVRRPRLGDGLQVLRASGRGRVQAGGERRAA